MEAVLWVLFEKNLCLLVMFVPCVFGCLCLIAGKFKKNASNAHVNRKTSSDADFLDGQAPRRDEEKSWI